MEASPGARMWMNEGARIGRRATNGLGVLLALAATTLLVAGCSGRPDASGVWEGNIEYTEVDGSEQQAGLALDLSQESDSALGGTMSVDVENDDPFSTPISAGEVREDGTLQIEVESQNAFDPEPITLEGEVDGDQISGEVYGVFEETETFSVERTGSEGSEQGSSDSGSHNSSETGETVQSSDDAGDFKSTSESTTEGQEMVDQEQALYEAESRYEEIDSELRDKAADVEDRLDTLDDPAADLEEELGPESENLEISDCVEDPAACEASYVQEDLERAREAFNEEGYNEAGCDAAAGVEDYAGDYGFNVEGGADYVSERADIEEAADGLAEDAREAVSLAREAEAALDEAEEIGDTGYTAPSYSPQELEGMVGEAEEAEERAASAVSEADERYEDYASEAERNATEAAALSARAGCGA